MPKDRVTDGADPRKLTVHELLTRLDKVSPDDELAYSIHQKKGITHRQMFRICNKLAHYFHDRGYKANDRVVLLGGNSIEYLIFYGGVWRYGLAISTINTEMNTNTLAEILAAVKPKLVLYDDTFDPTSFKASVDTEWLHFSEWHPDRAGSDDPNDLFNIIAPYPDTPDIAPVNGPDDIAAIAFTSGTSSKPKGVVYTYTNTMANGISTSIATDVGADDRMLEYRALSWASARARFLTALCTGATMVVGERFSRSKFWQWLKDNDITIAYCVPTVLNMLLEEPDAIGKKDLPRLRFVTSSTAPLSVERHRQFEATFGFPIVQFYGMSEGGNLACNPPDAIRLGSVGKICHMQDLKIVTHDGTPLPQGEVGEIDVGGPLSAWGYLNELGELEPMPNSRLRTGDIGYIDEDGYLFITGRAKDLIIRGGANIQPLEVDNVLLGHPGVAQAATVGVPDAIYGEEVVSYVVPRAGQTLNAQEVLDFCAARLPKPKMPKQIVFVGDIAKNDRGKVDRNAMKRLWLSDNQKGAA